MTYEESSDDTIAKAEALYQTLLLATDDPAEAATIITYLHTRLWLNQRAATAGLDEMLAAYCDAIRYNVALNETEASIQ